MFRTKQAASYRVRATCITSMLNVSIFHLFLPFGLVGTTSGCMDLCVCVCVCVFFQLYSKLVPVFLVLPPTWNFAGKFSVAAVR